MDTAKTNKQLLRETKNKCCMCGEPTFCCLELHHIRDKVYNISQAVKKLSTEMFMREIAKCIVVCSNCHKKLHSNIIKYENNK